MGVVRAGVMALLIGIAAVGATQHAKPGSDRSKSWVVKRHKDSVHQHPRSWSRSSNVTTGRPAAWFAKWRKGWGSEGSERSGGPGPGRHRNRSYDGDEGFGAGRHRGWLSDGPGGSNGRRYRNRPYDDDGGFGAGRHKGWTSERPERWRRNRTFKRPDSRDSGRKRPSWEESGMRPLRIGTETGQPDRSYGEPDL